MCIVPTTYKYKSKGIELGYSRISYAKYQGFSSPMRLLYLSTITKNLKISDAFSLKKYIQCRICCSDVPGLDFSGFGQARDFMYRDSGGPGFSVSGFGQAQAFPKY